MNGKVTVYTGPNPIRPIIQYEREIKEFHITNKSKLSKPGGKIIVDEKLDERIDYRIGSIVKYFKYETLSNEDKMRNVYLYKILSFATLVEGNERSKRLVIYQALYNDFEVFAKPLDEFSITLNKAIHPSTEQDFAYEILGSHDTEE